MTRRQVFLRELLSNACDALDKERITALRDGATSNGDDALEVRSLTRRRRAVSRTVVVVNNRAWGPATDAGMNRVAEDIRMSRQALTTARSCKRASASKQRASSPHKRPRAPSVRIGSDVCGDRNGWEYQVRGGGGGSIITARTDLSIDAGWLDHNGADRSIHRCTGAPLRGRVRGAAGHRRHGRRHDARRGTLVLTCRIRIWSLDH